MPANCIFSVPMCVSTEIVSDAKARTKKKKKKRPKALKFRIFIVRFFSDTVAVKRLIVSYSLLSLYGAISVPLPSRLLHTKDYSIAFHYCCPQ